MYKKLFIIFVPLILLVYGLYYYRVTQVVEPLDADKILALVSEYRVQRGLPPLRKDQALCNFATLRSSELTYLNYNHDGFHERSSNYSQYSQLGENLDITSWGNKSAIKDWDKSPGHHKIMNTPAFTNGCVSVKQAFVVLELGQPN